MQFLKDPSGTRKIKGLPLPPSRPLKKSLIFYDNNTVNWQLIKQFLKKQGRITKEDFIQLIDKAISLIKNQPNLLQADDPLTIVGDIHGQFYDFIKLLENQIGGNPEYTKYLFLGDYVDRGSFSIQVLILILSLKITKPKQILMLRGNHQCRQLTSYFNFKQQCLTKYDQQVYDLIMDMFDCLPLACLVNKRFLCIHGGISPQLNNLDDISSIDRFQQIPKSGLFCDLVWADPIDDKQGICNELVKPNKTRGCSYFFGIQIAQHFFNQNKIISIIRAHQAQNQGFKMYKWSGYDKFPSVITIFSAPNYCDFYNNKGAVIKFQKNILSIQQFVQSPHPYLLPNFMDLFTWSIPFVTEKVSEVFYYLLKSNKKIQQNQEILYQISGLKNLVQTIIYKSKQQVNQNIQLISLGGNCPDNYLLQNKKFIETKNQTFQIKKSIDQQNEKMPKNYN